jgi:L-seryl-tRNA(Ser) seleniumtransferase
VGEFLQSEPGAALCRDFGKGVVKLGLRERLDGLRNAIRGGAGGSAPDAAALAADLRVRLMRVCNPEGRRAINATGILLHTGLGRAPMCAGAMDALAGAGGYAIVQTDLESNKRCRREVKIESMLRALTGCEAATIVNNNAAATLLVLNTLAAGREVIVSRGQLVEIGGSYRLPDVMARSGAILREVGATNRTHLRDYEAALSEDTGAVIHVHTSNYRIRGFAGTPGIRDLAALGRRAGVPVIDDLGSGALVPLAPFGLPDEPLVADSIAAGADVACFSGDKLICGPQAGILLGKADLIARIRKNPFARMFRVCKLTLAAMEATLTHFVNGDYREALPFYRMLSRTPDELARAARALAARIGDLPGARLTVADDVAYVGSGSVPDQGVPTTVLRLAPRDAKAAEALAYRLRTNVPSIFCRLKEGALLFDLRTLLPGDEDNLAHALRAAVAAP